MGKRLLIACNNETDAKGLRDVFYGLSEIQITQEVTDGGGAVDAILGHGVDLMLLDLFLPGIDGLGVLEVVARLPEDRRPLIFVMTALPDDRLLYRIKDQVLYCFTKPLKYEIVQLRVLEILHMLDVRELYQAWRTVRVPSELAERIEEERVRAGDATAWRTVERCFPLGKRAP